jgi:hypothetical protein
MYCVPAITHKAVLLNEEIRSRELESSYTFEPTYTNSGDIVASCMHNLGLYILAFLLFIKAHQLQNMYGAMLQRGMDQASQLD